MIAFLLAIDKILCKCLFSGPLTVSGINPKHKATNFNGITTFMIFLHDLFNVFLSLCFKADFTYVVRVCSVSFLDLELFSEVDHMTLKVHSIKRLLTLEFITTYLVYYVYLT